MPPNLITTYFKRSVTIYMIRHNLKPQSLNKSLLYQFFSQSLRLYKPINIIITNVPQNDREMKQKVSEEHKTVELPASKVLTGLLQQLLPWILLPSPNPLCPCSSERCLWEAARTLHKPTLQTLSNQEKMDL